MTILDQLMQSPQLPRLYEQLGSKLAEEQRRRELFYNEITEDDKAEFINGEMIVHSPVKLRHVGVSHRLLILLTAYVDARNLGLVAFEKLLISLTRNDYEPDICFFHADRAAAFVLDQMRFPAPDFVVEILSPSTEAHDRGVKFEDYAAHGVSEYWLVDPQSETLEQYLLNGEQYTLNIKARTGTVTSTAILGFEIPMRAMFDASENATTLVRLLNSEF